MTSASSPRPVSALRARMIEDMTVRGFTEETHSNYIREVRAFAAFIRRPPDTATAEDLRRFQLHQTQSGMQPPSINSSVSALRFFFTVTLDRPDLARRLTVVRQPRRLPAVLSVEEITLLLQAAPGPKLPGWLIGLGDGVRLLHALHALHPRHQDGCFRRFDGAAGSNSQRDCRHTFIVRHIADEDGIVLAETIPTTNEFAPNGLARLTAHGFNAVLRIFELGGPRFRSVCCLVHIKRHVRPPFASCAVWLRYRYGLCHRAGTWPKGAVIDIVRFFEIARRLPLSRRTHFGKDGCEGDP